VLEISERAKRTDFMLIIKSIFNSDKGILVLEEKNLRFWQLVERAAQCTCVKKTNIVQ